MKGLKAYILNLGDCLADGNFFEQNKTVATVFDENPTVKWTNTPFYAILIKHPTEGWILYDCGPADQEDWETNGLQYLCKVDRHGHTLVDELAKVGVKPEEVKHVILSHMHIDHMGQLKNIPNADVYVARKEAESAFTTVMGTTNTGTHGFYAKNVVLQPRSQYVYLEDDDLDRALFEGVHLINLRGHTAGVIGLLLELESGNVLVTSDACNMRSNYEGVPGGIVCDSQAAAANVKKLHRIARDNKVVDIWFSHDEAQFKEMKKAPEAY